MQSKVLFSVAVMLSLTNAVKIHSMEEIVAEPLDTIHSEELIDAAEYGLGSLVGSEPVAITSAHDDDELDDIVEHDHEHGDCHKCETCEPEDPCKGYVDEYKQEVATLEVADRYAKDMVESYKIDNRIDELTEAQNEGMMNYFRTAVFDKLNKQYENDPDALETMVFDVTKFDIASDILDTMVEEEVESEAQDALDDFEAEE